MRFQRFLTALVWCLGTGMLVVALTLAIEKFAAYTLPGQTWWPFAIAGGLAVVFAGIIAVAGGPTRVDAAVAIDRAFHLNERLSTALTLPDDLRATPAGKALVSDAIRHVTDLDVGTKFGPRVPRRAWIPLIPTAFAVALLGVPALDVAQKRAQAKSSETINKEVVIQQSTMLGKKIAEQRKELAKGQFTEAEKLMAEIEKAAENLAKAPPAQKDKALVELNRLTDAVKERQKQLGSPDQVTRQLQQLKAMANSGPADDFAKSLSKGDFEKAAENLKTLQEKLRSGTMTEKDRKALQEQLGEMAKQLEKLANLDQRRKQLEEAKKNGGLSQEQFKREMAKLDQQAKALQKLQQLAEKLDQAKQQCKNGSCQNAAKTLAQSAKELSDMAKELAEMGSLDSALAELQETKDGMTNEGMNQIGESLANMGMGMGKRQGNGNGLGRGRGQGDRPEAPDNTSTYSTKVRQQFTKGKAVLEGFGPTSKTLKGQSVIAIQGDIETSGGLSADALTNQKVPKNVEKHIRGYFDQINKGK
jgi:hypothetical protein